MPLDETIAAITRCCILRSRTKLEALRELVGESGQLPGSPDPQDLWPLLLEREELMSTGIGLGIAIPHARVRGLAEPIVVLGLQKDGIPDYESIDGQTVRIVILILVAESQQKEYLRIVAGFVSSLRTGSVR
ncbi:PTS sugar transporter subunit IIA, partial [Candidatus Fermentibacterales bacterium]|nr:PTS sugar transporter subunit IIA [Candidatus Fermentibacterales bacterium]